jgi:sRNA-binding regulator protein Hfq
MANSSHIPVAGPLEVRSEPAAKNLRTMPSNGNHAPAETQQPENGFVGTRKLIRPSLAQHALRERQFHQRNHAPVLSHSASNATTPSEHDSSHAEAFYFQKQVQTQTLMAFVLEDGERIEGYIEWHDRNVIKVRNGQRILIYKTSIKYLYKVGENHN